MGTQLQRRGDPGREIPVISQMGRTFDLRSLTDDIDGQFLDDNGCDRARWAARAGSLPAIDVAGLRYGPPVARPGAVICIGHNYAAHAAESDVEAPAEPVIILKHPNTVVGACDDVIRPPEAIALDWEVELAVVIGHPTQYVESDAEALSCIAGYAVSNDVSERHMQIARSGGQWSKGKCYQTFNPLGPFLIPASEVPDPQALHLRSWVNGEPRQDSSTSDMIFSVAAIVRNLSQHMQLDPGDVINTGTPAGVGLSGLFPYLRAGDEMRMAIDGLGEQRQRVVDAPRSTGGGPDA